jgi:hypothetical protein
MRCLTVADLALLLSENSGLLLHCITLSFVIGPCVIGQQNGAPDAMSGQYEWKLGQPLPVLGAHSVAKHDIFEQYLAVYIERLTRTPSPDNAQSDDR